MRARLARLAYRIAYWLQPPVVNVRITTSFHRGDDATPWARIDTDRLALMQEARHAKYGR